MSSLHVALRCPVSYRSAILDSLDTVSKEVQNRALIYNKKRKKIQCVCLTAMVRKPRMMIIAQK